MKYMAAAVGKAIIDARNRYPTVFPVSIGIFDSRIDRRHNTALPTTIISMSVFISSPDH